VELDSSLVEYMRKRAEFAKLFACALSVQCFVLAVFFCAYGLCYNQFVFSKSMETFRMSIIIASIVISFCLVAFDIFVCIRYKALYSDRPDYVALRQSSDVVREAYKIARPILIFKITLAGMFTVLGGLIYILLVTLSGRSDMSGIYGRIVVCLCLAAAFTMGLPAWDRINAYRCALREIHVLADEDLRNYHLSLGLAILTPTSICAWYIMRFYTMKSEIAWIVFPMTALFGLAIVYLINWLLDFKENK